MRGLNLVVAMISMSMVTVLYSHGTQAQSSKAPIVWTAAMAPGGLTDIFSREVAKAVSEKVGRPIVVEPIGGGGGLVAAKKVQNAPSDGSAFLVASNSLIVNQAMRISPELDIRKDLVAVSPLMEGPFAFYVNSALPVKTLDDLVIYAKRNPGKLNYGSSGIGSVIHLVTEDFLARTNIKISHIPYKGGSELKLALTSNQVQLEILDLLPDPGAFRMLAVTSPARLVSFPSIQTTGDFGMVGFEPTWWIGVYAPSATPTAVLESMNAELRRVLTTPEMQKRFEERSWTMGWLPHSDAQKRVEEELTRWSRVVEKAKIAKF